jgi:diguanylate cyclase
MPPTSHSTIARRRFRRMEGLARRASALRALWVAAAALVGLEALHDIGVIDGWRVLIEDWVHDVVLVAAAALCLFYAGAPGRNRAASLAFGAGLAAWAAADLWWTAFYANDPDPPLPSVADALWLAWYPLTALGIALLIRRSVATFHLHRWLDGVAVMLVVLTPCAALFLQPAAEASEQGTVATLVVLSYPVLDALLIGGVLGVYGLLGWHVNRAWLVLGFGCVLMAMGDGLFAVQEARASTVDATYDFTWPVGALLVALAVGLAVDVPAPRSGEVGWRAIVLPLTAQALAAAIQVYALFHELGPAERFVTLFVLLVAMVQIVVSRPRAPAPDAGAG